VPPVVPRATVAIRKRARLVYTLDDYIDHGHLSRAHAEALRKAVAERMNIVIAGGTGSGKTTFANALLHEKVASGPPNQRFLILEDTIELQCSASNKGGRIAQLQVLVPRTRPIDGRRSPSHDVAAPHVRRGRSRAARARDDAAPARRDHRR
jgi:hypothetical protein